MSSLFRGFNGYNLSRHETNKSAGAVNDTSHILLVLCQILFIFSSQENLHGDEYILCCLIAAGCAVITCGMQLKRLRWHVHKSSNRTDKHRHTDRENMW